MSYIGPKEVKSVDPITEQYNGTIEMVKVTYADGTQQDMPKKMVDSCTTAEATDLTSLRDKRVQPVVAGILELMLEWGVALSEVNFITNSIALSVNASMNAATQKFWGKAEQDLDLIEVDKVLKQNVTLKDILPQA